MKKVLFFALLASLSFMACNNDDDDNPTPEPSENELRYDGPNATGPVLGAGTYEAAVRFPASYLDAYQGRSIDAIAFFLGELPASCIEKVYEGTTAGNEPQNEIYSFDVTSGIEAPRLNRLTLSDPIPVADEDLWLSIVFVHNGQQQSIGCDAGPNQPNGDWLYDSNDSQWLPYTDRTPESINWNIRGELTE